MAGNDAVALSKPPSKQAWGVNLQHRTPRSVFCHTQHGRQVTRRTCPAPAGCPASPASPLSGWETPATLQAVWAAIGWEPISPVSSPCCLEQVNKQVLLNRSPELFSERTRSGGFWSWRSVGRRLRSLPGCSEVLWEPRHPPPGRLSRVGNSEIANSLGQQSRRESPGCSHHFREYLMDWLTSTGFFFCSLV